MKYVRRATKNTPEIVIDITRGVVQVRGRSSPENSILLYAPLLKLLRSNKMKAPAIRMEFFFQYFNTSSSKCVYDILRQLKRMEACGTSVSVTWFYDPVDEDMLESGQDYNDLLDLNFRFVEHIDAAEF